MLESLMQSNGILVAISGLLIVFTGLVLIALIIFFFNTIFKYLHREKNLTASPEQTYQMKAPDPAILSDEELIAISTAIECYRRIHFEPLQSAITFRQGEQQSVWKSGRRPGVFRR
jgi:Na+-transporting methylmalonyl-CoA/oxaloacetate decarboxylase gamma subunit